MEKKMNHERKHHYFIKIMMGFALLLFMFLLGTNQSFAAEEDGFVYLSDIPYDTKQSASGWKDIRMDKAGDDSLISVKIDGGYYPFEKGIWAHATSRVVYDLTNYSQYDYFTAYIGLNKTAASSSNGVKFYIYTSVDGTQWDLQTAENPTVTKAGDNATFVKINIKEANFLKLEANDNGANGNDHSVYADAKLIKEGYKEPGEELVPSITELDETIKTQFANADPATNPEFELTLLKRELISRTGNYALRKFLSESEENEATYRWLTGDIETLRLYVLGGTPDGGNYYNSLTQLTRLYTAYKEDFTNEEKLGNAWAPDMTYGDLYKKMAITLSLTHSQRVALWMQTTAPENQSDAVVRYQIYKDFHKNGKFIVTKNEDGTPNIDITPWFETLQVEEMRFVMNNALDDEESIWLNEYIQTYLDQYPSQAWKYLTPHPYMAYVNPNYANPIFHDQTKKEYWDEKFGGIFSKYNVSYSTPERMIYKVWMNFRNEFGTGAVCGGISKTGSNIRTTHGIPATVIGQPGHAALLYYTKDAQGKGYWNIDNDVSGWTLSEKGERLLLGWGNANTNYARGSYQVVYMALAQEAINDYANLVKCEEQVMLAKVYQEDVNKQEQIYEKALETQPINVDAWLGLINTYQANPVKTENDYYALAERIADKMKYFPLPMQQLTNLIKPQLTSIENVYKFTLLQTRTLTEASNTPNNTAEQYTVYQPAVTRVEANYLLGRLDKTIATFSFDGADAGKIVLASKFDGNGIRWEYSLDGKQTWIEHSFTAEEEHKLQLTPEQISSITSENDIYIHLVGVDYDEKNLYQIDIIDQGLPTNLYANDWENSVIGVTSVTEWRYTENEEWTPYHVASPDLTGDKKVQIRQAATGTKKASESVEYSFTQDNQPDNEKYIRIAHLTIDGYSTQSVDSKRPFYAPNAIDGNLHTMWHTDFRYDVRNSEIKPYIIIQLDESRYLSAFEFIQQKYKANDPDFIKSVIVSVSEDKENWIEAGRIENCPQKIELRKIQFEESVSGKYVKVEMDTHSMFASLAMVNLYEDTTKKQSVNPTAEIQYNTQEATNQNVVAKLVNPSTEITITNNEGKDTYVFTENGDFTFEFEDVNGNKGSATAKVTWIDKDEPTADITYELDADKKLLILLDDISEDVYLLDRNNNKTNYIEVDENKKVTRISYLDSNGNPYKILEIEDGKIVKKVIYLNTTNEVTKVRDYVTILDKGMVAGEEYWDENGNPIQDLTDAEKETLRRLQQTTANPLEYIFEESGEYEFKILDKASNLAYKSIKVDYIDNNTNILASDITYNITKATNQDVVATIKPYVINENGEKVDAQMVNNDQKTGYTFTQNGSFTFTYKDAKDTNNWEVKEHTAKVTWIDKVPPTAEVEYSTTEPTDKVIATLKNESEDIIVTNNNTSREYIFTENGEFTFEFEDLAGNKGTAKASVNWIQKEEPPLQYQLGDVNQDGKITGTDLVLIKRHIVAGNRQEWILTKDNFTLADMNEDGKITATDLILVKRQILKQLETQE